MKKKKNNGIPVVKKDDTVAIKIEEGDATTFLELSKSVDSIDEIIHKNNSHMAKSELIVVIDERRKAAINLEKFVTSIYKKYNIDDSHMVAFDVSRGEIFELNEKRPLWRFK